MRVSLGVRRGSDHRDGRKTVRQSKVFFSLIGMNNKHILRRKWAIAIVALMVSGCFSPIGMRLLDYFEIKAPLSDIILSTILILIACVEYRLILKYRIKDDE